jgi:hypothetical protein
MRAEQQERPVVNSWDKLIDYCSAQVAPNKVEEFHYARKLLGYRLPPINHLHIIARPWASPVGIQADV